MKENIRIIEIILSELNLDKAKAEEELERVVNSDGFTVTEKVIKIKALLKQINGLNGSILAWMEYVKPEMPSNEITEE